MEDQSNDQGENLSNEQPKEAAPEDRWPQKPPQYRDVYGFTDPQWNFEMVAMTVQTWVDIMDTMQRMHTQLEALSVENIKMKQGIHPEGPRIVLPS